MNESFRDNGRAALPRRPIFRGNEQTEVLVRKVTRIASQAVDENGADRQVCPTLLGIRLFARAFIVMLALMATMPLKAATNDLTTLLQRGLFEEEANRNLDAAITSYESLAKQFDKDRQIAATAIFRLGECYRKLGKTNEAVLQYERIVREFSDQPMLATLSRQNLVGMGLAGPAKPGSPESDVNRRAAEAADAEAVSVQKELKQLQALTSEQRRVAVQQNYSNPVLTKLMQDLADTEQKLINLRPTYMPDHPLYKAAEESKKAIEHQIDRQVDGTLIGLQAKLDAANQRAKQLRGASGSSAQPQDDVSVANDEDKEIRRIQAMIQNSPDLINSTTGGGTPLIEAAGKGQLRVVTYLLDHGANVDLQAGGTTPLITAAKSGNKAMVELLLNRGADLNATDGTGGTALHAVAENGFRSVAEVLLAHHADLNARNSSANGERTPLHLAAKSGRAEMIKLLVGAGANVNARSSGGSTPLLDAVQFRQPNAVAALLEAKADPNLADNQGFTPLSVAALYAEGKIADQLLAAKADPNLGPLDPPLLGAIKNHNTNMVEQLLRTGADPNRSAQLDWQLLDLPAGGSMRTQTFTNSPMQFSLSQPEMVRLLLKFKANPNGTEESGPLLFQALLHPDSLRALLDADANPNVVQTNRNQIGDEGETPLMAASRFKLRPSPTSTSFSRYYGSDFDAAQMLIAHGADVNFRRRSDGTTPLHWAVENGSKETVNLLLVNGGEVNVRSNSRRTPLDFAKQHLTPGAVSNPGTPSRETYEQIAALLRKNGARDDLPDFSVIRLTRQGVTQPRTVFQQNTNGWNQFTLMETLMRFYTLNQPRMIGGGAGLGSGAQLDPNSLAFPDLTRIIIHRPSRTDESKTQDIHVNLLNATNGIVCSKDVQLEFGDVVEIPVREYRLQENPVGLTTPLYQQIADCLKRQVTVKVRNETRTISAQAGYTFLSSLIQRPDVQNLLLSSSDLAHVMVTRQPAAGDKAKELVLDMTSNPAPEKDLWLRDGDVIEIPEK